jgi:hypothetical protein
LTEDHLAEMLAYILCSDESTLTATQTKIPFTCTELLTADSSPILDRFFSNPDLLDQLFSLISGAEPINPTSAGYVAKIASALFQRCP